MGNRQEALYALWPVGLVTEACRDREACCSCGLCARSDQRLLRAIRLVGRLQSVDSQFVISLSIHIYVYIWGQACSRWTPSS